MRTDSQLVSEVKEGDRNSFAELVARYQIPLLRLAMRFTKDLGSAEDVVQEAFIKAYRNINTFEGRSSFKNWLYQIAMNTARNKLREWSGDAVRIDSVQVWVGAKAELALIQEDLTHLTQSIISTLPERQRIAVILRIFEEMSFKEIAQIMQCPYDTAKANYRHGLLKIKERFKEEGITMSDEERERFYDFDYEMMKEAE